MVAQLRGCAIKPGPVTGTESIAGGEISRVTAILSKHRKNKRKAKKKNG
jgi:hypothetical protein